MAKAASATCSRIGLRTRRSSWTRCAGSPEGHSNSGIAQQLVVSERAVEKHVSNIFWKLDLPAGSRDHRRVLAILAWIQESD